MQDRIEFQRYRGLKSGWFEGQILEMAQLTTENYFSIEKWLEANGSEAHFWTNESFIVGLWVFGTWHDGSSKTPAPFGWWVYRTEDGRIGVAAEVTLGEHYASA
jgi:hypothetical protein